MRVEHADLAAWLEKHIQRSDYVVIESTTNAWYVYDLLEPLAEKVLVANPIKVKQIAQARVKTDIRDTLILARMLAANIPGHLGSARACSQSALPAFAAAARPTPAPASPRWGQVIAAAIRASSARPGARQAIATSSPAARRWGAGVADGAPVVDWYGKTRRMPPDIGACED